MAILDITHFTYSSSSTSFSSSSTFCLLLLLLLLLLFLILSLTFSQNTEKHASPIEVTHWHFLGWPDRGVPQYATSFISFIRHVRKNHGKYGPPILTHCSDGVGRTGTFILLDSMLDRLMFEDTISVYEFVRQMRTKRLFMVQTLVSIFRKRVFFLQNSFDQTLTFDCSSLRHFEQSMKFRN